MNAVKVDSAGRIQLDILTPGDLYEPEIRSANEITLHRVPPPRHQTRQEVLQTIDASPLRFTVTWEQLRAETRE